MTDVYQVEKIVGKRWKGGKVQYKVKWEGYPYSQCTWEPLENLQTVIELIDQYNESQQTTSKKVKKDNEEDYLHKKRKNSGSDAHEEKKEKKTDKESSNIKKSEVTLDEQNESKEESKDSNNKEQSATHSSQEKEVDGVITIKDGEAEKEKESKIINIINLLEKGEFKVEFDSTNYKKKKKYCEDELSSNQKAMNFIAPKTKFFIGGSADLSSSTNTYLKDMQDIKDNHYFGKNIWFGVREHSMGSILNGLALSGFKPFGSTFLTFSDYMKPAIRLSALMNLPVNYIFTHDSINIGPDGPTHQPIEQLAMLRSTPNLMVFRPADANELIGCWDVMLNSSGPNALVLSRQDVRTLPSTVPEYVKYGAYPVRKERKQLHGIIIATGTEVFTSLLIAEQLYNEIGLDLRVISMPCQELFLMQQERFKNSLIPGGIKTIVVEAGSSFGWYRFVINEKYLMTIDKFGISGTKGEVENYCNFTFEQIKERIRKLF